MLLEEIEAEIDLVTRTGACAMEGRDFDEASEALQRAGQLTGFRDRADALQREWAGLAGEPAEEEESEEERATRRDLGRLRRGLRTPEPAYYRPILEAMIGLGGRATMAQVLENVGQRMQGFFGTWTSSRWRRTLTGHAGVTPGSGRGTGWSRKA